MTDAATGAALSVSYAAAYHDTRRRIGDLVGSLRVRETHLPVPACPAWDVHDLLAHISGVPEKVVTGTRPPGGSQELIDAAVAERRDVTVADMLRRWEACAPAVSELVGRIPLFLVDLVCHEHDLRQALGQPGARTGPEVAVATELFLTTRLAEHISAAGLGALQVNVSGASWTSHDAVVGCTLDASVWESMRVLLSRRTGAEVRALTCQGDVEPYLRVLAAHAPLPLTSLHEGDAAAAVNG